MGETFHPASYAEIQPGHRSITSTPLNGVPTHEPTLVLGEEEPYTIKCICGFDDDAFDGATVFCEQCNTWQHIACYYAPNITLSPDAIHGCIDCNPDQRLDTDAAVLYQKALRQPQTSGEDRKPKRTTTKNHKKSKTRELNHSAVLVNGFAGQDGYFANPAAGSPRDNPPPAKKHKTSHRPSVSIGNGHSRSSNGRHRSASNTLALANPPRPPLEQCPEDYLSPRFIEVHRENINFNPASENLMLNFSVTNLLSTWLDDQDAFAEATNGKSHSDVFLQFPQSIEELETPIQKFVHEEPHVRFHGSTPQWPYLAVDQDLVQGEFVGEIRGCIGKREDYQTDAVNQWNKLRHPDHFVFFHPSLPIYIDARQEGTILRYARRSCRPNLKLETIITGAREYRFCFTAMQDIPRGTEITIPWDTKYDTHLQHTLLKGLPNMTVDDFMYVSDWVGNNLAHFGGCACENQRERQAFDGPCLLATFDRRACKSPPNGVINDNKSKKKRGHKKLLVDNLTQGSNSRESSEEVLFENHDGDIDMPDGRSTSQSTKSSRDATPSNNHSRTNGTELSERDKKKLAQQERFFEQMENDKQQPGPRKKKRTSGSNNNTPTVATHRHSNRPTLSPSNPGTPIASTKPSSVPPHRSPTTRSPPDTNPGRLVQSRKISQPVRPVYVDATTQTTAAPSASKPASNLTKKVLPRSKQLLKRSLFQSRLRNQNFTSQSPKDQVSTPASPNDSQAMDTESSHSLSPPMKQSPSQLPSALNEDIEGECVVLHDVEDAATNNTSGSAEEAAAITTAGSSELQIQQFAPDAAVAPAAPNPEQPVKPPAPPWAASSPERELPGEPPPYVAPTPPAVAPVAVMHVDMQTKDFAKPAAPTITSPSDGADTVGDQSIRSPSTIAKQPMALSIPEVSARNPGANSITKPSPVKKKMSLSDYMSKRNKPSTATIDKTPASGAEGSPSISTDSVEVNLSAQSPQHMDETKD